MNIKKIIRKTHYWFSLVVFVPLSVMIVAGLFLMMKKEVAWIQPPTQTGVSADHAPNASIADLFTAARAAPDSPVTTWADLARADIHVNKGVIKFVTKSNWEVQVDVSTRKVHSVAYRRSDLIEQIHDGSFFSGFVKYCIFLPTGVFLLIMMGTGAYLFMLPLVRRKPRR